MSQVTNTTTPSNDLVWPAPRGQIEGARDFILESVSAKQKTLIVPDKDADGLSSGAILRRTLLLLSVDPNLVETHLVQKGDNIHNESERRAMAAKKPSFIFVLDQGSRSSPPVIDEPHKALVIDHHWALEGGYPRGALHVSACHCPPVATSSLLTYHICADLHPDVESTCDWLCVVGTHGDLGNSLKWDPPFPDMTGTFKTYTKKALNEAVSLVNAPRRTPSFNVADAWEALTTARSPAHLLGNPALLTAKAQVKGEVERCSHTPPQFSSDGRIALLSISSPAQVHPLIATRWAGYLRGAKLEVILVANNGYLPGMVNFSCRIPVSARKRVPPVNIIHTLCSLADKAADPTLKARLGESFARGHKEASGGIVPNKEFEELVTVMDIVRRQRCS